MDLRASRNWNDLVTSVRVKIREHSRYAFVCISFKQPMVWMFGVRRGLRYFKRVFHEINYRYAWVLLQMLLFCTWR